MYPLTHLYYAEKVLGFLNDAVVLGSIFPDIVILCGIEWEEGHTLGYRLWQHFQGGSEDLVNFSLGVVTHGVKPKGLDYYSDEKYRDFEKGYCFEKSRPLITAVVEATNISSADGWWKAHNFIEMGIELYIYEKRPELLMLLKKSFANDSLITKLSRELSLVLHQHEAVLNKTFYIFKQFVEEEPLDAQQLALRYQRQIYFRHNIDSIDLVKSQDIIQKAKELVASDIDDFFTEVKEQMESVWKDILPKK